MICVNQVHLVDHRGPMLVGTVRDVRDKRVRPWWEMKQEVSSDKPGSQLPRSAVQLRSRT